MLSFFPSPVWARNRVTTASSPHKRGRCCPFFPGPVWARNRVTTASSPYKRGRCCPFSYGPVWARIRLSAASPQKRGQDAVNFFATPPRKVGCTNCLSSPFPPSRYRCEPMAASTPRRLQSSHASTHHCLTIAVV